jgi:hypothetical protein
MREEESGDGENVLGMSSGIDPTYYKSFPDPNVARSALPIKATAAALQLIQYHRDCRVMLLAGIF